MRLDLNQREGLRPLRSKRSAVATGPRTRAPGRIWTCDHRCIRTARLANHKSAAMPGYATGARLAAEPAASRPSCRPPASPRPSTDRPARIRTGNAASKARRDCRFPHGADGRPAPIRTGTPSPRTRCASGCATGLLPPHTREHGPGSAKGWRRPQAGYQNPTAPRNPCQRMAAALPSSNAASRCWDPIYPNGFHNAVCIMRPRPRTRRYLGVSPRATILANALGWRAGARPRSVEDPRTP